MMKSFARSRSFAGFVLIAIYSVYTLNPPTVQHRTSLTIEKWIGAIHVQVKDDDVQPVLATTTIQQERNILHHLHPNKEENNEKDDIACLTLECMDDVGRRLARAFPDRPQDSWCIPAQQQQGEENAVNNAETTGSDKNKYQGLLLVKIHKAASSTSAGVTLRIANRTQCRVEFEHRPGREYLNVAKNNNNNRTTNPKSNKKKTFIFAPIRKPSSRLFSHIWWFQLDSHNIPDTDKNIINLMREQNHLHKGGYQFQYMSPIRQLLRDSFRRKDGIVYNVTQVHEAIAELIHVHYDFLLVVERMDESLVAMALLLGLKVSDVLVRNSKQTGHYIHGRAGRNKGKCHLHRKEIMSNVVESYTQSTEFIVMNYADEILWRAANASLDMTIEQIIGQHRFNLALQEYKHLQQLSIDTCGNSHFGCTVDGKPLPHQDACYFKDFGCGYQCVDEIVKQNESLSITATI